MKRFGLADLGNRRIGELAAEAYVVPEGQPLPGTVASGYTNPYGVTGKVLARVDTSTPAATDQISVCAGAARLRASGNPSAGTLAQLCLARRQENIAKGIYVSDGLDPNDGAYRVALVAQGDRIIAANPTLAAARAKLPNDEQRRGYTIAQGVRAGKLDGNFLQFIQKALPGGELLKGFNDAMAAPASLTQAGNQGGDGFLDSIPRPVLIGGAALLLAGLGFAAWKLKH